MRLEQFSGSAATSINASTGEFSGYAVLFDVPIIRGDDVTLFQRGCFTKALQEAGRRVRVCWQHDIHEPIGRPLSLTQDEKGLLMHARLDLGVPLADRALKQLLSGVVTDLSVGLEAVKTKRGPHGERVISESKLFEVSLVTFGACDGAQVLSAFPRNTLSASLAEQVAYIAGVQAAITTDKYLDAIVRRNS